MINYEITFFCVRKKTCVKEFNQKQVWDREIVTLG